MKMIHLEKPLKVSEKLEIDRTTMKIKIKEPRLLFTEQNFTTRASRDWNRMPESIRTNNKLTSFKKQVKGWVKERRGTEPDCITGGQYGYC